MSVLDKAANNTTGKTPRSGFPCCSVFSTDRLLSGDGIECELSRSGQAKEQSVSCLVYLTGGCMAESVWFRHLSDEGMRCELVLCHACC